MITSFFQYLEHQKQCSQHTLTSYRGDLEQFIVFLKCEYGERVSTLSINYQHIRQWVVHLMDEGLSAKSINRKLACLRTYYNWLEKKGTIEVNPTLKIKSLKTPKSIPQYVQEKPMKMCLDEVSYPPDFIGQRDKLIIEILYGTGMRRSELCNLRDKDIDLYSRTIKVLGKRNKERIIPIHKKLADFIKSYQNLRDASFPFTENSFLVNKAGKAIQGGEIYKVVNHYLSQIIAPTKKSPHVLRHTFATHLLSNGADINSIKELLGHASLGTTQIYAHTTVYQLKLAYDQAHPKSGL